MLVDHDIVAMLSRPPTDQDGRAHYATASFEADRATVAKLRQMFRGKPIAVVAGDGRVDLIALISPPLPVLHVLGAMSAIVATVPARCIAMAPDLVGPSRWCRPKLTARDRYRVALAVAGLVDLQALASVERPSRTIRGVVENSAGTHTYVGGTI